MIAGNSTYLTLCRRYEESGKIERHLTRYKKVKAEGDSTPYEQPIKALTDNKIWILSIPMLRTRIKYDQDIFGADFRYLMCGDPLSSSKCAVVDSKPACGSVPKQHNVEIPEIHPQSSGSYKRYMML